MGVGRHGPGANVFAYFIGPDNVVIEYTGEVDQVDDDYPTGMPEDWTWPPGRVDQWGVSDAPSKRLHEAQQRVVFAEAKQKRGVHKFDPIPKSSSDGNVETTND